MIMTINTWNNLVNSNVPDDRDLVVNSCPNDGDVYTHCADDYCQACNHTSEFSDDPCETCRSRLGGSRHALAAIKPGTNEEPLHYSVCQNCLFYVANGDLPEHVVDPRKATAEQLEELCAEKPVIGANYLALKMMDWHAGQGDPIYAVASSWVALRPVPVADVREAIDRLPLAAAELEDELNEFLAEEISQMEVK